MRDCRNKKKAFLICSVFFWVVLVDFETSKTHYITMKRSGRPSPAIWHHWSFLIGGRQPVRRVTDRLKLMMAAPKCTVAMATWWNNKHRLLLAFCLPTRQRAVSHQQENTHIETHTHTHTAKGTHTYNRSKILQEYEWMNPHAQKHTCEQQINIVIIHTKFKPVAVWFTFINLKSQKIYFSSVSSTDAACVLHLSPAADHHLSKKAQPQAYCYKPS